MNDKFEQQLADFDRISRNASANLENNNHYALKGVGALLLAGTLVVAACSSDGESVSSASVVTLEAVADTDPTTTALATTTTESPETTTSTTEVEEDEEEDATTTTAAPTTVVEAEEEVEEGEFMPIGITGEAPCGPKIDRAESLKRLEAGQLVATPEETVDFLNSNSEMEAGLSAFYEGLGDNSDWITVLGENLPVQNEALIDGVTTPSSARILDSLTTAHVLGNNTEVQNHACNLEEGTVYENDGPNGQYNKLQKGEQLWVIEIPQELLDRMEEHNVELPDELIVIDMLDKHGKKVGVKILLERLGCNNPILELPPEETPPETTTTTTTTPETTTTVPETNTTVPDTTTSTTSTTTTTIPHTTTTTTVPPTTSTTSTTTTTIPQTTTTTTVPPTTSTTSTTTTTIPQTTTTRPEVSVPVSSTPIGGEGAGGEEDEDDDPENNVTTSTTSTTTTVPTSSTTTTTPPITAPPSVTTTTLGTAAVE